MSRKAQIIVGAKNPPIVCTLVDYSPGGACLALDKMIPLPNRFELLYGNVRKKCRVAWTRGYRMGVVF
jgi:hypothetical protein